VACAYQLERNRRSRIISPEKQDKLECYTHRQPTRQICCTSANELKLRFESIGSILAFICSQASKTAAPYISELADAAVGDALGTYLTANHSK